MRKDIREGVKKHMIDGIKPNYAALVDISVLKSHLVGHN